MNDKDDVVAELTTRFPDADPAELREFVDAAWDGPVDDLGLMDWVDYWRDAEHARDR